ncbi:hypothetical protein [Halomonas denitrificans]|uniref:hypothetical protein n=1 Tax=Halomonas denitrificans TaxID=370769 RepID=UPI001C998E70|nr:hypothetical protein [Halomonas denitrificans]MBY5967264.1 hypothetical protein [Halomonas denitrificans]
MGKSLLDRCFTTSGALHYRRKCRLHQSSGLFVMDAQEKKDLSNEMQRNSDALHMAYLQKSTLKCGQDV